MEQVTTNEFKEILLDEESRAHAVQLEVLDTVFIADFIYDRGDGYRPFSPLLISIGGTVVDLPLTLDRGTHLVELVGEEFVGVSFRINGLQLHNIRNIKLLGDGELSSGTIEDAANELLTGVIDGVNQTFATSAPFVPGTTKLYVNTARMVLGVDYTESGDQAVVINDVPVVGDLLRIDYLKG